MNAVPPTPGKPGWYWDPRELEFNLRVRERWRRNVLYLAPDNMYRLRRWDGRSWTDDTLQRYRAYGLTGLPYLVGPTSRMHPETPRDTGRRLKLWVVLMTLSSVGVLVFELVK